MITLKVPADTSSSDIVRLLKEKISEVAEAYVARVDLTMMQKFTIYGCMLDYVLVNCAPRFETPTIFYYALFEGCLIQQVVLRMRRFTFQVHCERDIEEVFLCTSDKFIQ